MGWELRSGHLYYYRKKRIRGGVHSEYWGRGEDAELIQQMDAGDPLGRQLFLELERSRREQEEELVKAWMEIEQCLDLILTAELLGAGFRKHKGEWRKMRHEA